MSDGSSASLAPAVSPVRHFGVADVGATIVMNLTMGLNVVAMKNVVTELQPLTTTALRFGIVFLFCLPWIFRDRHHWQLLAAFGFLNGVAMAGFMSLSIHLSRNIGALSIVAQLSIPFSVVLGVMLLGERVNRVRVVGTVLAFVGVVIMLFDPRIADDYLGVALMTGAALAWSACTLLQRRLSGAPLLSFYAWTGLMAILFILPAAAIFEPGLVSRTLDLDWNILAWLAFMIIGSTIIGNGCITWMFRHHPVSIVMPLMLGTPVVAVISAWLLLDVPITLSMVLGGAMVIGGIVLIISLASANMPRPVVKGAS